MKLSVVIPTLGRKKELIDTIQALMSQTVKPDELVVIDQNEPSFLEVDTLLASIPSAKHLRSKPGLVPNYNLGLKHATGEIVLFLDDDIVPDPKLIETHLKHYESVSGDSRFGGVAGRVEQPSGDLDPEKIPAVGRYYKWSGRIRANFNATSPCDVQIAPGGNMSFRREVLNAVNGFDEGFNGNGYFFETDGSLKVHEAGYRIIFEPRASMKHLMAPAGGARIRDKAVHTYYYVKNGIRLYRKHSPAIGLPAVLVRMFFYSGAKSVFNLDPRIFVKGCRAILDGVSESTKDRR